MPTPQDYPTTSERCRRLMRPPDNQPQEEFDAARARLLHAYAEDGNHTWAEIAELLSCDVADVMRIFTNTTCRSLG